MDTTLYEMMDPDVNIRRVTKKLFALLWLKHRLIATLPPSGPTSPHRINDMSDKIAKSVLVYSYASRPVLQYYMEKHSRRIRQSKMAFWTHTSFLCLRIRLVKDNLFDYFLNVCSIISEVALFCNWKNLDSVHTYASTFLVAFFETELSSYFYVAGGWAGLMNHIEDDQLLELYEGVEPYRNEMKSPCDLVPIMITVASEALSAQRRERLASSRELKAEDIEKFEPVRLLTAKIFNWDFMEQLHISSLKPGVFKRVANIRRKSKGKIGFNVLPKPRCFRQLYIAGDELEGTTVNSVSQMNSSPNLRVSEYDTPQQDSKVFQRSVSVHEKPTDSSQVNPTKDEYFDRSVDDEQTSSSQDYSGLIKSKDFGIGRSVDEKSISSLEESSNWIEKDCEAIHRSDSAHDKPASSFLMCPSLLTARGTKCKCSPRKISDLNDNLNRSFIQSQGINSTAVQVNPNSSKDISNSETLLEIPPSIEHYANVQGVRRGNETIDLNAAFTDISNNLNDTFVSKSCNLDSKAKLQSTRKSQSESKAISFEKHADFSTAYPKSKPLIDSNNELHGSADSKCDSSRIESTSSTPSGTLLNKSILNSESSCNPSASIFSADQSETEYPRNELIKQCKKLSEKMEQINLRPEACASAYSITKEMNVEYSETDYTLKYHYQSFEFAVDGIETLAAKSNRTVYCKKQLFGTLSKRIYSLKPSTMKDIEYLESVNSNKRFSVNIPGAKQKEDYQPEVTESASEPLPSKNSKTDNQKVKEFIKPCREFQIQ